MTPTARSSVWTEENSGDWRGGVVRNDNSTSFETDSTDFNQTKYGNNQANTRDNLFGTTDEDLGAGTSNADANMVQDKRWRSSSISADRAMPDAPVRLERDSNHAGRVRKHAAGFLFCPKSR